MPCTGGWEEGKLGGSIHSFCGGKRQSWGGLLRGDCWAEKCSGKNCDHTTAVLAEWQAEVHDGDSASPQVYGGTCILHR